MRQQLGQTYWVSDFQTQMCVGIVQSSPESQEVGNKGFEGGFVGEAWKCLAVLLPAPPPLPATLKRLPPLSARATEKWVSRTAKTKTSQPLAPQVILMHSEIKKLLSGSKR